MNDENEETNSSFDGHNNSNLLNPASAKIAQSHPTIPVSHLDLVETRSCPDLDNEYNNMSDDIDQTPPQNVTLHRDSLIKQVKLSLYMI